MLYQRNDKKERMKRKILFFAPSLAIGGAERVLVNLLKRLDYKRYDVTLCLFANFGDYLHELPEQVKLISIFKSNFIARVFTFFQRKFSITFPVRLLTRMKIKEDYDVGICFSDGLLTDNLLFAEKQFVKKIAWVHSCYISQVSLHRVFTPDYIHKLIENRYKKLDDIVFVSEKSREEFEELFGIHSRHHVVYNIFDTEAIVRKSKDKLTLSFNPDMVKIIAIGRMVDVKEYSKLIDAAAILASKGLKFEIRIVGDGKLKDELIAQTKSLQLTDYIHFPGFIANPYPCLKMSDILVLTSSSEALPTVLIEAMTLGIPIVSTRNSGALEITDNGKYALLTEHTVDDIAAQLEKMILSKDLRVSYAHKAKERVKFFDEAEVLGKVNALLAN